MMIAKKMKTVRRQLRRAKRRRSKKKEKEATGGAESANSSMPLMSGKIVTKTLVGVARLIQCAFVPRICAKKGFS